MLFSLNSFIIILPKEEAAPVCMTAYALYSLHLSSKPIAVKGFTNEQAPYSHEAFSSS
jgi:hypothetical protein